MEGLFDELSGTGLSDALNRFAVSMNELSKNSVNKEFRSNLLQTASNLADTFGHFSTQLAEKQMEQDGEIVVTAGQINDIADSIVDLNLQIAKYELSGQKANDLRDRRNKCWIPFSLTPTRFPRPGGQMQVRIGTKLRWITVTARPFCNPPDSGQPDRRGSRSLPCPVEDSEIWWRHRAVEGADGSGDGSTGDRIGMPFLSAQLDQLARGIAESINAVHSTGWTYPADSNGNVSITGVPFFATSDGSSVFTASNMVVDPAIVQDVYLIAASSAQITDEPSRENTGMFCR